jgi:hypothetical protein
MNRAFICIPGFPIEFTNSSLSPVSLLILALQSVTRMSDWFHDLPVVWMAVAVFGFTCLLAGGIHIVVHALAVGERACRLSPCHLACPLGYRLRAVCGFTAAQAWSDGANASATVDREASALRSVTLLAAKIACVRWYRITLQKQKPRTGRSRGDVRPLLRLRLMPCPKLVVYTILATRWSGPRDCSTRDHKRSGKRDGCSSAVLDDHSIAGKHDKIGMFVPASHLFAYRDCFCP